jgi:hypothetical protein
MNQTTTTEWRSLQSAPPPLPGQLCIVRSFWSGEYRLLTYKTKASYTPTDLDPADFDPIDAWWEDPLTQEAIDEATTHCSNFVYWASIPAWPSGEEIAPARTTLNPHHNYYCKKCGSTAVSAEGLPSATPNIWFNGSPDAPCEHEWKLSAIDSKNRWQMNIGLREFLTSSLEGLASEELIEKAVDEIAGGVMSMMDETVTEALENKEGI